eukprot:CCRYP_012862-RA/>CCRYP_012862-RA protein AED:0.00 eAED:0.00 QI:68/1/1/1/1/1/2/194/485
MMASAKRTAWNDDEDAEHQSEQDIVIVSQETTNKQHHDPEEVNAIEGRRKKKKIKVMSDSGQTIAERQVLRQELRQLHGEILSGVAGLGEEGTSAFDNMRQRNNNLWERVRYNREAVLESMNVELIADFAARQTESIIKVPRYDANRLVQMLVKKATVRTTSGATHFGWKGLGVQAGICFNSLPSHVSFLYGPLDAECQAKVSRKAGSRKKRTLAEESDEEEQPLDVDQTTKKKSDGNELSAVESHMKTMYQILIKRSKEEEEGAKLREKDYVAKLWEELEDCEVSEKVHRIEQKTRQYKKEAPKVNAIRNLFNPQSFTQTVENIFHFSFLVKESKAAIEVRSAEQAQEFGLDGPGPVIMPLIQYEEVKPPTKQAIVSLTMKDWRDMCTAFNVEESDVPHRGKRIRGELKKAGTSTTFKSEESTRPTFENQILSDCETGEKCKALKLNETGVTLCVKPLNSKRRKKTPQRTQFNPNDVIDLCFDD